LPPLRVSLSRLRLGFAVNDFATPFGRCRRFAPASALPLATLIALLSQSLSPFGRLGGRGRFFLRSLSSFAAKNLVAALPRWEFLRQGSTSGLSFHSKLSNKKGN